MFTLCDIIFKGPFLLGSVPWIYEVIASTQLRRRTIFSWSIPSIVWQASRRSWKNVPCLLRSVYTFRKLIGCVLTYFVGGIMDYMVLVHMSSLIHWLLYRSSLVVPFFSQSYGKSFQSLLILMPTIFGR